MVDDEFHMDSGPMKFFHNELVTETINFSFQMLIKGFLKNSEVTIKRISRDSKQGMKEDLLLYEFMSNGTLNSHLCHGSASY